MNAPPESPYRHARRAFIAACEAAHVESVARLNPAKAADGKPLFMDSAARGPRHAHKAMLVAAQDAAGSGMLIGLLQTPLPPDAGMVLVHALDPAAFAGVAGDPGWPSAMLAAVAAEDLSKVRALGLLALGGADDRLKTVLGAQLPLAKMTVFSPAADIFQAVQAVNAFFAE